MFFSSSWIFSQFFYKIGLFHKISQLLNRSGVSQNQRRKRCPSLPYVACVTSVGQTRATCDRRTAATFFGKTIFPHLTGFLIPKWSEFFPFFLFFDAGHDRGGNFWPNSFLSDEVPRLKIVGTSFSFLQNDLFCNTYATGFAHRVGISVFSKNSYFG